MALAAPVCAPTPTVESRCRLTTFAWGGAAIDTYARVRFVDGRAYVRLPTHSPALERIWNMGTARVAPYTPGGRPNGPPTEGEARVVAGGAGELYVEIVPSAR